LLLAFPLAAVGAIWFYYLALPWPLRLQTQEPERTAFMRMRLDQANERGEELPLRHTWVPLERISPHLRRAAIAAEDGRFYQHEGIDWGALREEFRYRGDDEFSFFDPDDLRALRESFNYYRENRERIRGRSTITQQVVKNLYYGESRSTIRKVEEYIVARRLERFVTKDRILEIYLNIAELGPGIFGAEAAARTYFNRSAADLSREQAAALAATLPHPLTSNPAHRPARMQARQRLILQRMGGSGPVETVPLDDEPEEPPEPAPAQSDDPSDTPPPVLPQPDTMPPPPDTLRPVPPRPDTLGPEPPRPPGGG
jgi:monofunctional glycosyltransferase